MDKESRTIKRSILKSFKKFYSYLGSLLFYDIYSMSIGRYAKIKAKNKTGLISRIPLPKFLISNRYLIFSSEVVSIFGGKNAFSNFRRMIKIDIRTSQLKCILYSLLSDPNDPNSKKMYRSYYHTDWKNEDDTKKIHEEIKRLQDKNIDVIYKINKSSNDNKEDFYDTITNVEQILNREFNMKMKLYSFSLKFKQAKQIIDSRKNG